MKRSSIEGLKHNAKLDVRLPDQLKDEFLARCREEGVSSGAVIRSMILDYVTAQPRRWPAMAAGLKETIVKRSKWIAGGISGGAVAAMGVMSVVFAPTASAEDVRIDFELSIETADEDLMFSDGHSTQLGQGWLLFPENEAGEITYAIEIWVRACEPEDIEADAACEIIFDVEFFEALAYHHNEPGGVTVTDRRVVANPVVSGQLGQTLNYFSVIEDGEATLTFKTLVTTS